MGKLMRLAIGVTTVLGIVLLALSLTGINALATDLEAATPQRVPAPASEQLTDETREIDCPLRARERPRI